MERLTEYTDSSPAINTRKLQFHCDVGGYIIGDIARRLAAYEDICFGEDGKERITIDELSELVKAQDEGRVLPEKSMWTATCHGSKLVLVLDVKAAQEAEAAIGGGGDG